MLKCQLEQLARELPASVHPAIQPEDIDFAVATITKRGQLHKRPDLARQVAAGIAWERALIDHVAHVTRRSTELGITGVRWQPTGARFDLDLVVADHRKGVCWVLDAKLAKPDPAHVRNMPREITAAANTTAINDGCPSTIGLIVHHRRHLEVPVEATNDPRVHRCSLHTVTRLLLQHHLMPAHRD